MIQHNLIVTKQHFRFICLHWRFLLFIALAHVAFIPTKAQSNANAVLQGRVFNANTNEPVPFATLVIWGTSIGSVSDLEGNFIFTGLTPGYLQIGASSVGFEDYISEKILVTNANTSYIEIPLLEANVVLSEIVVKASPFRSNDESPVSLQRIEIEQIEKNPGGNRDVSKVLQSLPGVASVPAFRNDVIVRGGGPSENRFMLDGVEIPNLNHFATQGASGGPVGIINVDFIREINFYTGAFPASTNNAMSSVLDMRQIDANKDKIKYKASIGANDLALTLNGPLGDNTSLLLSYRRSYLQFLFAALDLPFLPTYNDYQLKLRTRLDDKNEISIISIGAYDVSRLNLNANETPEQKYILSFVPEDFQWNYTIGAVYKHFASNGYHTLVVSRNYLHNESVKYVDNDESKGKSYQFFSDEIENKLRYERFYPKLAGFNVGYGISAEYAKYSRNDFRQQYIVDTLLQTTYNSFIDMYHYGLFAQASRKLLNDRLTASLGIRADGSTYSAAMQNMFANLSPRLSLSYLLGANLTANMNVGRYYQRPAYTTMGYKDLEGELVNKSNNLTYIYADHIVGGIAYRPNQQSLITVEGFYKMYHDYPFSLTDSVPLASKGASFGTFGDEAVTSISSGRAYGLEVLARSQDFFGFNTILSYTYVRSEFKDERMGFTDTYIPTSWDNKHLLNITTIRKFRGNWYVGAKWRYVGGAPYTPVDTDKSGIKAAWDAQGAPYLDYSKYNTGRLLGFHQLDIRIDKEYYFKKWSLNLYVDVQNVYGYEADSPPFYVRSSFFNPQENDVYTDANGIERYNLVEVPNSGGGTVLPSIGIIVEF